MEFNIKAIWPFLEIAISITLTLIITYIIAKLADKFITKILNYHFNKENAAHYAFFKYIIVGLIYFIGFFASISMIPVLKNIAYSILASSSIVAVVGGFASKEALSQILSGFLIQIFKPFSVGDYIKVESKAEGQVIEINLRHTILINKNGDKTLIPNATISNSVITRLNNPKD